MPIEPVVPVQSPADAALYALLDELSSQLERLLTRLPIEEQRKVLAPLLAATNLEILPKC
jgi:hypothetical protein